MIALRAIGGWFRPRQRAIGVGAYWRRVALLFAAAQVAGYFISIELRDRYSQNTCFLIVYVFLLVAEELIARYGRGRRALSRASRHGCESSAIPFQDT